MPILHCFVGDGALMKPPEDLMGLRLVVSNGSGYGKGGKEFDCSCDWQGGSILRFHQTVVLDDAADPINGKLTFELKGNFKDAPAKDVSLGIGAFETNPKQKARTITLDLTNFSKDSKVKQVATICRLAVTLYHNKFPVNLSPDEIALRHKSDMLKAKDEKKKKSAPSAREYNFLLSRRINWDQKDPASWNKETEGMLDEDVLKNLKDFQKSKGQSGSIWTQLPDNKQRRWLANNPKLAYAANRYNSPRPKVMVTPHRNTLVGVGFVGDAVNPVATKGRVVREGKAKILYKKKSTRADAEEVLYNKMVAAEKRRLRKTKVKANRAHFQSSLDRAKAKIIAEKAEEDQTKAEMLKQLVTRSDAQLKQLRNEINRRKRRLAYIGLQKHISEADARRRKKQEDMLREKEIARQELNAEAVKAIANARVSRRDNGRKESHVHAPVNAIPLRKTPNTALIKKQKEEKAMRERLEARRRLDAEAKEAKAQAQVGGLMTSTVAPGDVAAVLLPKTPASPPRKKLNPYPLRKSEEAAKRVQIERAKQQAAAERRANSIYSAMVASEVMRQRYKNSAPYIPGVTTANPYPLRKASTPKFTTVSTSRSYYSFSEIGQKARRDMIMKELQDSDDVLDMSGESEERPSFVEEERPFTYELKNGEVIKCKTLKELQHRLLQINRNKEIKRTNKLIKARAKGLKGISSTITSSYKPKQFSPSKKKYGTPVGGKYKQFYNKEYTPSQDEPSATETKELIADLGEAVHSYGQKSNEDWLRSSQGAMEVLTARSQELTKASRDVEKYGALMSKDDTIIKGTGTGKKTPSLSVHKVPGFLKAYQESGQEVPIKTTAITSSSSVRKKVASSPVKSVPADSPAKKPRSPPAVFTKIPSPAAEKKTVAAKKPAKKTKAAITDAGDDIPAWAQKTAHHKTSIDENLPSWATVEDDATDTTAAKISKGANKIAKQMKKMEEADKFIDEVQSQQEQDEEAVAKLKKTLEAEGVTVDDKMMSIIKSLQEDTPTGSPATGIDAMGDLESALNEEDDDPSWT